MRGKVSRCEEDNERWSGKRPCFGTWTTRESFLSFTIEFITILVYLLLPNPISHWLACSYNLLSYAWFSFYSSKHPPPFYLRKMKVRAGCISLVWIFQSKWNLWFFNEFWFSSGCSSSVGCRISSMWDKGTEKQMRLQLLVSILSSSPCSSFTLCCVFYNENVATMFFWENLTLLYLYLVFPKIWKEFFCFSRCVGGIDLNPMVYSFKPKWSY